GTGERFRLLWVERPRRIEDDDAQLGLACGRARAADSFGLDGAARLAEPGGVDQDHRNPLEVDRLLERVARGPRVRRDDRPLAAEQAVEQGRLADARHARDRDARAAPEELAGAPLPEEAAGEGERLVHSASEPPGAEMNLGLVHELDRRLAAGDQVDQEIAQG